MRLAAWSQVIERGYEGRSPRTRTERLIPNGGDVSWIKRRRPEFVRQEQVAFTASDLTNSTWPVRMISGMCAVRSNACFACWPRQPAAHAAVRTPRHGIAA